MKIQMSTGTCPLWVLGNRARVKWQSLKPVLSNPVLAGWGGDMRRPDIVGDGPDSRERVASEGVAKFRAMGGRALQLFSERPNLQFGAKEASRVMSTPRAGDREDVGVAYSPFYVGKDRVLESPEVHERGRAPVLTQTSASEPEGIGVVLCTGPKMATCAIRTSRYSGTGRHTTGEWPQFQKRTREGPPDRDHCSLDSRCSGAPTR